VIGVAGTYTVTISTPVDCPGLTIGNSSAGAGTQTLLVQNQVAFLAATVLPSAVVHVTAPSISFGTEVYTPPYDSFVLTVSGKLVFNATGGTYPTLNP